MALRLGQRHAWVKQSEIRDMSAECDRVRGINMAQGVCDLEVPLPVRRGAQQAMEEGLNVYTHYTGMAELRNAIAYKHQQFNGRAVDPNSEIVVSAGATGAFYCTCLALLDPGDEVIVFEPYYGYHINTLREVQAVPVFVGLFPPDWGFTPEDLEKAVTSKTRAMVLNTPANPSGKVFSREELEIIAVFARKHELFVITDEIYEHFIYDGLKHISPAAAPGMKERTITISGLSKAFSITGWRVGYCICDARWAQAIGQLNDLIYICAPAPLQIGAAKGLMSLERDYYENLALIFKRKRDKICEAMHSAGLNPHVPQGTYYVLADLSRLPGQDGKERVMNLLRITGVAGVPGTAFYHETAGETLARFCFAKDDQVLDEACRRLMRLRE
jgi:aminotransferase